MTIQAERLQPAAWQYPLGFNAALTIECSADDPHAWVCRPEHIFAAATPAWGLSQADVAAARLLVERRAKAAMEESLEEGVAEAFVDLLRHEVVPPVPGFRVVRLVPPPEATGERPVNHDSASDSVVVGERVVVTWVRQLYDTDHAAPRMLAHLDAVDFFAIPETHGILLWTTPSGREIPVAWATKYLPRSRDGWDWCVDLTERSLGLDGGGPKDPWVEDFPARLGRLAAKLHVALATPSKVVPQPLAQAPADLVRAWHTMATQTVDRAAEVAEGGTLDGATDVLVPRLPALRAAIDQLLEIADGLDSAGDAPTSGTGSADAILVQPVHGDLHVGQVLRWPGGLAVIDFHPDPVLEFDSLRVGQARQPAARDLARLLRSLDNVGRVADKSSGFTATLAVDAWSAQARHQLLAAYKRELASAQRPELLDERLLAPFEAEQLCRELVYSSEHLPAWAYAPLGGLWQSYPVGEPGATGSGTAGDPVGPRRGRHADPGIVIPT